MKERRTKKRTGIGVLLLLLFAAAVMLSACGGTAEERSVAADDDAVASVTVFASSGDGERVFGLVNLGHAFLMLTNEGEEPLDICGFSLGGGESATISTWSLTKSFGIWFNVESAFVQNRVKYTDRVSVTCPVSAEKLSGLGEYLKEHNTWTPLSNCSAFTLGLYNELAGEENRIEISGILTPKKLKAEISRFRESVSVQEIVTQGEIGYLDKDGVFVGEFAME